ncbi:2-dehydropantoate 2-reductase N-terminal domain-containing protein [Actinoplanes sp. NPDC026670]|uniref:ketopantoate reductase family protein n=1 Tax=Actinoplanes sp. NPDC026670 TaxID=3154700 RepID=UPI0033CF6AED
MSESSVLIVGAGAVGLSLGYHLHLAGAQVTFLVRPGRAAAFSAPRRLYDYNDNTVKTFDGYGVVEDAAALTGRRLDFVIVTLDGHTSRTDQGTATLRAVGDLIHGSDTVVLMDGIGVDLRRHYLDTMRLPGDRLLLGFLGMLAHQASAGLPVPAGADPDLIAGADICYVHPPKRTGFTIATSNKAAATSFAALYDRSATSRIGYLNPKIADVIGSAVFTVYAACDIAGWPPVGQVIADKPLWTLACRAQSEILSLPRNGLFGRIAAAVMGPKITAKIHLGQEKQMLPLDTAAFNGFHHGGKVRAQDMQVLRDFAAEGKRLGRPMTALTTLIARADERHHATPGQPT